MAMMSTDVPDVLEDSGDYGMVSTYSRGCINNCVRRVVFYEYVNQRGRRGTAWR